VVIAIVALVAGIIVSTGPGRAEHRLVTNYVNAWARGDYSRMYGMLDSGSQHRISEARFASAYKTAASTATLEAIILGRIGSKNAGAYAVTVRARTRLFGTLRETLLVPLQGSGSGAKVRYAGTLLFPGLRRGEQLSRQTSLASRASLLASDGTPLAEGPDRTSPIPDVASQITGRLASIPTDEVAHYESLGYPANAKVGINGLERIFQDKVAGTPGGTLRAGSRVLGARKAVAGHTVKTTIVPAIERASVAAMGNHYAGIAAMNPRTGAVLALAGVAFSALQPPGSTMKIITATAALQAHAATLSTTFPVQSSATIDGYELQNANGESCGGTLLNAFAVSCNSVFAPLGAKVGGAKLVAMAERFGFNHPMPIPGAAESTIPPASQIGDALAVGSSAIGQGKVLASALQMTDVGATIAMGGRRPIPTAQAHQKPRFVRVTSRHVAHEVQQMMIAVVQFGTGVPAQIPGVTVAGKTGTAELRNTVQPSTDSNAPAPNSASNTDAWFVGYAPVGRPRIVVGALFPAQGAGAQTAAPAVKGVLEAGLSAH
jgi:cell division protein FtsI/penicillin-binding protein 2